MIVSTTSLNLGGATLGYDSITLMVHSVTSSAKNAPKILSPPCELCQKYHEKIGIFFGILNYPILI